MFNIYFYHVIMVILNVAVFSADNRRGS